MSAAAFCDNVKQISREAKHKQQVEQAGGIGEWIYMQFGVVRRLVGLLP
jgi:hypothetical protein